MLKKMWFVGGWVLLSLVSQIAGAQTVVFGPEKMVPTFRDSTHKSYTFVGPQNNVDALLKIKIGDGRDLSPRPCSGKGLALAKCKVENVLRQLEVLYSRPHVVEVTLNNQVLVSRQNYEPALGFLNVITKINSQNILKAKVAGAPTSSVELLIQTKNQAPQPLPIAHFSMSPESGIAPQMVVLNAMLSSSQGGTITAYEWDFGDGQFATGSLVTHVYARAGTYQIKLTVTDNLGQKASLIKNLSLIENQAPVANFSFTQEALDVQFDASSSQDSDGNIISYQWDFGDASAGSGQVLSHSYSQAGAYSVRLTVTDDKGAVHSISKNITLTIPMPPTAKISLHSPKSGQAPLMVWLDSKQSSDPQQLPLTVLWDFGDGTQSTEAGSLTHEFKNVGQYVVKLTVTNTNGLSNVDQFTLDVTEASLPQDPAVIAPPLLQTAVQSLSDSTAFLYSGSDPVQKNVNTEFLDSKRTAVISGKVLNEQGQPLSGAKVMILNTPEYGYTLSRQDGRYDLVVNGGGEVIVDFSRNGFLPSQRKLTPDFMDYAGVPDVVMVARDPQVTKVTLDPAATGFVIARGSTVTDSSGTRTATMVIPANAKATLIRPDGTSMETSTLSLRATEYTVGDSGPQKMPGTLPRTTGYMYAVELSADEGTAIGAEHVQFDRPVSVYVDNFLGFSPGVYIPVGVYSFSKALWEPQDNGLVIKVLAKNGNDVSLDIAGNSIPATTAELDALGMTLDELQVIGNQFAVGASFWRVRTDHFSPMDQNALLRPSPNLNINNLTLVNSQPVRTNEPNQCPIKVAGSIIDVNRQVLGESLPIVGVPFSLNYSSARSIGRVAERTLWIPLIGTSIPTGLLGVNIKIEVAGRTFQESLTPVANLTKRFEWDGKDIFGRIVQGGARAKVTIGYQFPQTFANAGDTPLSFGRLLANTQETNVSARLPASFEDTRDIAIGSYNSVNEVGGWDVNIHHFYDVASKTLFYGDGSKVQSGSSVGKDNKYLLQFLSKNKVAGFAGDGGLVQNAQFNKPVGAFVASDGSLYVMDTGNFRIRKITKKGLVSTVAGDGTQGFGGDGGDALSAQINPSIFSMFAEDNLGQIYFSDTNNHRIRKISKDGVISTVIGTGVAGLAADNTPAGSAMINGPEGIAINEGTIYFADSNNNRVRAMDPMGLVYTVATQTSQGTNLVHPRSLKMGPDSSLYVSVSNNVYIISSTGRIEMLGKKHFMSINTSMFYDQLPFQGPTHLVVEKDRRVFILNSLSNQIWISGGDTVKYFTNGSKTIENVYPADAQFTSLGGMDIGKDGAMYLTDGNQIKVIRSVLPEESDSELSITSQSGSEIFVFSKSGRHLRTINALTGSPLWIFDYTPEGLLVKVTDGDGKSTQLVRDSQGRVTSIVSPFGQITQSIYNAEGYLASLTNPAGHTFAMEYQAGGLLSKFTKPSGASSRFTYDQLGQLTLDENAKGGFTQLLRTLTGSTSRVNFSMGLSNSKAASLQTNIVGDEVGTNISAANISTEIRSFNNEASSRSPFQSKVAKYFADPYFGGLSSYVSSSFDTLMGNSFIVVNYQQRSSDVFDYVKNMEISLPAAGAFTTTYDAKTRIMTLQTPSGGYQTATYDHQSRPVRMVNGDTEPLLYQYNTLGQLTNVTQGSRITTLGYTNGLLTSIRNPAGQVVSKEYDQASRLIAETRPDGKKVLFDYDVNGNLVGITPPGKTRHQFGFDVLDLVSSYLPPLLSGTETKTRYSYDSENKLKEVINPEGKSVFYNYDSAGRISRITTDEGDYVYTYSPTTGLLTSFSSPNGVTTTLSGPINGYTYTLTGELNLAYAISEVSIAGRLETADYTLKSNGQRVVWAFDRDGNKYNEAGSFLISRLPATQWISKVSSSIITYDFKYNKFGETTRKSAGVVNQIPILDLNYTHDDLGRVIIKSVINQGGQNNFSYSYDLAGRLSEVKKDGVVVERYVYDDNGNRVEGVVNGVSSVGVYDSQDRLVSYGGKSYGYNLNGELTSITGGANNKSFAYNSFGYLKQAQVGGKVIDYILDGRNNRVGKKVDGVLAQTLIYSNEGQIIFEIDNATQVSKAFAYAAQNHVPDQMIMNGVRYLIVTDAIGSVRMVLDRMTGAIMQELDYDAFGNVVKDTNPGFQPFGFAGGVYDRDTGFVRFGARDYNAETGRWTSKDPILFAGGDTNLFGYVANDPINNIDPTGTTCQMSQSSGVTICANMDGQIYMVNTNGYSGSGAGQNNPAMQSVPFQGPIPQGSYTVGTMVPKTPSGLINALPLTPNTGTNTFGRDSFFIHGDNPNKPPGTSSSGCPIMGPANRSLIPPGEIFNVGQ